MSVNTDVENTPKEPSVVVDRQDWNSKIQNGQISKVNLSSPTIPSPNITQDDTLELNNQGNNSENKDESDDNNSNTFKDQNENDDDTRKAARNGDCKLNGNAPLAKIYSLSSEIIPQTLTHPDDDLPNRLFHRIHTDYELNYENNFKDSATDKTTNNLKRLNLSSNYDISKLKNGKNTTPRWSSVGFQSIFQNNGSKRSNDIVSIKDTNGNNSNIRNDKKKNNSVHSFPDTFWGENIPSRDVKQINKDKLGRNDTNRRSIDESQSMLGGGYLKDNIAPPIQQPNRRRSSIFSFTSFKDSAKSLNNFENLNNQSIKSSKFEYNTNKNKNDIDMIKTNKGKGIRMFKSTSNISSLSNLSHNFIENSFTKSNKSFKHRDTIGSNTSAINSKLTNKILDPDSPFKSNNSNKLINNSTKINKNGNKSNKSASSFLNITRKIFRGNNNNNATENHDYSHNNRKIGNNDPTHRHTHHNSNDTTEAVIPNSLSKFLHSSVNRHRSPSQFINNTTTINNNSNSEANMSMYSFNSPLVNNNENNYINGISNSINDFNYQLENNTNNSNDFKNNNRPENLNTNHHFINNNVLNSNNINQIFPTGYEQIESININYLYDLLKNMPSLEANYKTFNSQELIILCSNLWGIFTSIAIELFKNKRIWQLPIKMENINRILQFYLLLRHDNKIFDTQINIINEFKDFITTSLYVFENHIVFNYTNEDTMNIALKRLVVIWKIFYEEVYYDIIAIMSPLETFYSRLATSRRHTHHRHSYSVISDYNNSIPTTTTTCTTNTITSNSDNNSNNDSNINSNNFDTVSGIESVHGINHNNTKNDFEFNSNHNNSNIIFRNVSNNSMFDNNYHMEDAYNNINNNTSNNSTLNNSNRNSNINDDTTTINNNIMGDNKFQNSGSMLSINIQLLILCCFRDSIVLPYYQNFIHSDEGVSKSFHMYIANEEEENGVTEQDKLTLLQCFGILSTIKGHDKHQAIMEDLLEGIRMSI